MIQAIMLIALGFLTASLIGVLIAPSFWSRAARLSKKRLEATLPLTLAEIDAAQDQLRAAHAVRASRLESALASAKQKVANQLADNSRLQMQIIALKDQIAALDLELSERRNAATVLEQTITKRFPELDREITAARAELQERSFDIETLTSKLSRREEELAAAQDAAASYQEELQRLHQVLERGGADRTGRRVRRASQWDLEEYRSEYDRLNLELSKLRQQLALFQERDSQQTGVIKGELQRLAESILVSAQTKSVLPELESARPSQKRIAGPDARRERPTPWLPVPPPAPPLIASASPGAGKPAAEPLSVPTSRVPSAEASDLSEAAPPGFASSQPSSSQPSPQAKQAPTPALNGVGNSRPKILQEVVTPGDAVSDELSLESSDADAVKAEVPPAANEAADEIEKKEAASQPEEGHGKNRKGPHEPVLSQAVAIAQSAELAEHNGAYHAPRLNGESEGTNLADVIHVESLGPDGALDAAPKDEKIGPHLPTLLERLRVAGEEPLEGEKSPGRRSV